MKILVMTDSRGNLLEKEINSSLHEQYPEVEKYIDVTVRVMDGATLDTIIRKMESKYSDFPNYDIVYVHAGVNNLTKKTGSTVIPMYDNIPHLVDDMTDKFPTLKLTLARKCPNVVIVQLVGIDMARYNREIDNGFWYYQQKVINEAMPILAHTINFVNRADGLIGPWLTCTVHDFVNGNLYNRYGKLRDGLHPSLQTQKKWAKLFVKSIHTNYEKMYV